MSSNVLKKNIFFSVGGHLEWSDKMQDRVDPAGDGWGCAGVIGCLSGIVSHFRTNVLFSQTNDSASDRSTNL